MQPAVVNRPTLTDPRGIPPPPPYHEVATISVRPEIPYSCQPELYPYYIERTAARPRCTRRRFLFQPTTARQWFLVFAILFIPALLITIILMCTSFVL